MSRGLYAGGCGLDADARAAAVALEADGSAEPEPGAGNGVIVCKLGMIGLIGLRGMNPRGRSLSGRTITLPAALPVASACCTPANACASSGRKCCGSVRSPASSGASRTVLSVWSVDGLDAGFEGGSIWIFGTLEAETERLKRVLSHARAERGRVRPVSSWHS